MLKVMKTNKAKTRNLLFSYIHTKANNKKQYKIKS